MGPEIIVPIFICCIMPVSIVWIVRHYRALEKGLIKPRQGPLLALGGGRDENTERELEAMKREKRLLEERVRNLESIVCSVDMELNARLNRLAQDSRQLGSARPASAPAAAALGPGAGTASTVLQSPLRPPAAAAAPPLLAPGRVLHDRYTIERQLGHGGMGAVFLARDAQLGELVALKVVSAHLGGDSLEVSERFRREASAARKITHPNVIRIHDIGEDAESGQLFLSMEYFAGLTLAELLVRRGALPLDEARDILGQIADGLEAAHRAGVVHRDLKPGNVLVGEQRRVKLIDFGLAKTSFLHGMTATGLIMGTPEYMAPEQIRGREVDTRTDLYALGAVAYHVVTGVAPFVGDSPIAVGFAHCTQPLRPPRQLRADLPVPMNDAIVRALAKEPRDRQPGVAEFRAELLASG
jgi:serine/threonine-protein kinase